MDSWALHAKTGDPWCQRTSALSPGREHSLPVHPSTKQLGGDGGELGSCNRDEGCLQN